MRDNCKIRRVTTEDLPTILSWRNHPRVREFMLTQHEISLEEHTKWYKKACQDSTRQLLIVEDSHVAIGYVQFSDIAIDGDVQWGFYARPDAPRGSGKKLGITALDHAFKELKVRKVCGQTVDTNKTSIAFHKRLGFNLIKVVPDQLFINDVNHALIYFELCARDWLMSATVKENTNVTH